jgi:protein-S-isoprenylcysteine O-methyltransferase Ste14
MLDIEVIRVLSILLEVGTIGSIAVLLFFTWEREDLGSVKASKPTGFVLYQLWLFLVIILPPIFYLFGAVMPGWVYGTFLNLSFSGAEYLQIASVPLFLSGAILAGWSEWAIGQFMRPHTEVMEKHELVTRGPYSRIRHPTYTGAMVTALASAFLFLHAVPVMGFLACFGIAYKKALLEEELLASESGFGQDYRDYMSKTGRFLPRLWRTKG